MRNKLPIIVAVIFGIIAFLGIASYLKKQQKEEKKVVVLSVKSPKSAGHVLSVNDFAAVRIPRSVASSLPGILYQNDLRSITGRELRRSIQPGDILVESMLESIKIERKKPLADLIKKKYRAMSIPVDRAGMVSGLVRPGDHVDILANMEVPQKYIDEISVPDQGIQTVQRLEYQPTTIFILENVVVLSVGQEVFQTVEEEKISYGGNTITIAVTPEEAQLLSFAMRHGSRSGRGGGVTFTLLLRNSYDNTTVVQREVATYEDILNLAKLDDMQFIRTEEMKDGDSIIFKQGEPQTLQPNTLKGEKK